MVNCAERVFGLKINVYLHGGLQVILLNICGSAIKENSKLSCLINHQEKTLIMIPFLNLTSILFYLDSGQILTGSTYVRRKFNLINIIISYHRFQKKHEQKTSITIQFFFIDTRHILMSFFHQ